MKSPQFLQIDTSIFGDTKILLLTRKCGGDGLAVYLYLLIQMNQNMTDHWIDISDNFVDGIAATLDIDQSDIRTIIQYLEKIGLILIDNGLYYSKGYLKRSGSWKESNWQRSDTQKHNKANEQANTQPEVRPKPESKPKPDPKPYQDIVDYWNSITIRNKCTKLTSDVKKAIDKRLAEYAVDDIKRTIKNYLSILHDPGMFFKYEWNLTDFLKRDNGFPTFYNSYEDLSIRYLAKNGTNGTITPEPVPEKTAEQLEWESWSPEKRQIFNGIKYGAIKPDDPRYVKFHEGGYDEIHN